LQVQVLPGLSKPRRMARFCHARQISLPSPLALLAASGRVLA
jgi:hypothetical protein